MEPGEIIASRFVIERHVAGGGMGRVYRAHDRQSNAPVAVKILTHDTASAHGRFTTEAALLAQINHPGIVRHIAHGRLTAKQSYLVMEWLEGLDLSQYLKARKQSSEREPRKTDTSTLSAPTVTLAEISDTREEPGGSGIQPLPVDQVLILARRLASAAAELHRRGIVHRDIKPANLFLSDGVLGQAKLIDLGVARNLKADERLTAPGRLVGTPYYMAPEQARANEPVSPATDIWAIGCVLYQCLSGVQPFRGNDIIAVLASIVLMDPKPISELRNDVPDDLAALIMRMLQKSPHERPSDGDALVRVIEGLATLGSGTDHRAQQASTTWSRQGLLTSAESRVMCMLFADASGHAELADDSLTSMVRRYGGQLQRLADGTLLVTIPELLSPADQATQAARAALALQSMLPQAAMVLVTGRAEGASPLGSVIRAAAQSLRVTQRNTIRLDELTANLLETRFHLKRLRQGALLGRPRVYESMRKLLGKPTPCVGRRRELALLSTTFEECIEDGSARAVLVRAPAGMGKSRLRSELLRTLHREEVDFELIYAQGDMVSGGSPFAMIGLALRRLVGILDGEDAETQRRKLRLRLAETVAEQELDHVATYLGEMLGLPPANPDDPALRTARQDSMFLGQLMQRAWERWLDAECARRPVLLVLEDLHWGDLPSVQYVESALQTLRERPWMVLALARPEVHQVFPRLWATADVLDIPLHGLSRKACATLIQHALGDDIDERTIDELVTRANGNAFYLEELICAVAEGTDHLPDTVLGMVEVRLDALGPEAKRVLRAASIFGEVFWQGGVESLAGESGVFELREWLDDLEARELVQRQSPARIPGENEYKFRHALVREGAYAMLTEDDRRLGHALAGTWLEQAGEHDPLILAEHFMRGNEHARAIPYLCRAAEQALEGNDLEAVIQHAGRAATAGASGELLGRLRMLQTVASYWLADYPSCQRHGIEALELIEAGSTAWFTALSTSIVSSFRAGNRKQGDALIAMAMSVASLPGAEDEHLSCLARIVVQLTLEGRLSEADPCLARIDELVARFERLDPRTMAHIHNARAIRVGFVGNWEQALGNFLASVAFFEQAGDTRNVLLERPSLALACAMLGDFEQGLAICQRNIEDSRMLDRRAPPHLVTKVSLGVCLSLGRGELEAARRHLGDSVAGFRSSNNQRMEGWALGHLATVEHLDGQYEAEALAIQRALECLERLPTFYPWVLGLHGRSLLVRGRVREALDASRRAWELGESLGGICHNELLPLLTMARCLDALGEHTRARGVIREAVTHIDQRARRFARPEWRRGWLSFSEIQQILKLARTWLAGGQAEAG